MPKKTLICDVCGKEFERYVYEEKPRYFCGKKCMGIGSTGANNSNFGNKWTDEQKTKAGADKKRFFTENPDIAYRCGSTNRGKKFNDERIQKMHASHPRHQSQTFTHTDKSKSKISDASAAKWTDEYKQQNRAKREASGQWIPLEQKSDWEIYKKLANWKCRMWDTVDGAKEMLDTHGIFNYRTNTKGVVRDHIYSRKSGFFEGVFPEILRHPANCQVILHAENVAKKPQRCVDRNDITLEQLFENIRQYNKPWDEQELVLQLIQVYENGKRYQRN